MLKLKCLYHKSFRSADIWDYIAKSGIISKTSGAFWISVRHNWSDKVHKKCWILSCHKIYRDGSQLTIMALAWYIYFKQATRKGQMGIKRKQKIKLFTGIESVRKFSVVLHNLNSIFINQCCQEKQILSII